MMRIKPAALAPNEFAFRLETNDAVHPQALGTFLRELERIAHLRRHFGPEAEVRLVEIATGSVWGKIAIATGTFAGVGSFALALEQRFNSPTDPLAQAVAAMSLDSSVVSATIITRDRVVTVQTVDMPALETVAQRRALAVGDRVRARVISRDYEPVRSVEDQAMVEIPLHGRINHWDKPRADTYAGEPLTFNDDALAFGGDPLTFGRGDPLGLPAPMKARADLTFGGSGDLRATRYYVGQIHPAGPLEFRPRFETSDGKVYWIQLNTDIADDRLPYGLPVVVRAEIDEVSSTMLVFEAMVLATSWARGHPRLRFAIVRCRLPRAESSQSVNGQLQPH